MRSLRLIFILTAFPTLLYGQLSVAHQKTMKSITDYASSSADEVADVVQSLISYYPKLHEKNSMMGPRYVCPVQLEDYYYDKVLKEGPALANIPLLNAVKEVRAAAEKLDGKCKALDTYHKLEDYKQDNFDGARKIIGEILPLIIDYDQKQDALMQELDKVQKKAPAHSYTQASDMMRTQLRRERGFLDLFRFNLQEEVHTGWLTEQLAKSILETDEAIKQMERFAPKMNYPASSMWPSFIEGLKNVLEIKRTGLDEYNFEAKKSDDHSNEVYLSLINYYNGVLVSDYNSFLGFASGDKFFAVPAVKYFPIAEIRAQKHVEELKIVQFQESPFALAPIPAHKFAIQRPVFTALSNYVEFLNETYRQIRNHGDAMRSLNSSAAYYSTVTDYTRRGGLSYRHEGFELPQSSYQKTVSESNVLPKEFAEPLNKQCAIVLAMLKELDETGAVIEQHTAAKRYEADHCAYVYQLIERSKVVFDAWDTKKEAIFDAVRNIFDSYMVQDPKNSWQRSGDELWKLTVLDRDALFLAKKYYGKGENVTINTDAIDQKLREVISNEYDNMKGLQKYGRSNGLCPYTPYEDLPKDSKALNEHFKLLKPAKPSQANSQHPYHSMVYMYNEVVDSYNKFASLSTVAHLPAIYQPELFLVQYPERKEETTSPSAVQTAGTAAVISTSEKPAQPVQPANAGGTGALPTAMIVHDTVYVQKRDTVYLHDPNENVRSMEGYATNNMVLLLDVSGSMNSKEKLPLLKQAVLDMLSMMREEDKISILVFSGKPKVLLQNVSFKEEDKIKRAINDLKPGGTTDGNAGIKLAYKVADQNYVRGGNNRIIMATDGEFVIEEGSNSTVRDFAGQDIFLSVFNFSKTPGKKLQELATLGKGNYELINAQNVQTNLVREAKSKRAK
jgi:Ca-activated chloride channel homolog